jgi:hypothetical protein
VLFAVETFLPTLRAELPVLAALHTVNALVIFGLAIVVAQRATDWVRARPPATVGP